MAIFYTSHLVSPPAVIFMGRDKYENDEMIKYCLPEDVWFHVDKFSSAHVYLRWEGFESIDKIPIELVQECAQIVKANSIEGCKQSKVVVVYTMWTNLRKTNGMDDGQVGFVDERKIKRVSVEGKNKELIKHFEKSKVERNVDFAAERREYDKSMGREKFLADERQRKVSAAESKRKREQKESDSRYADLMKPELMKSNQDGVGDYREYEDNFM